MELEHLKATAEEAIANAQSNPFSVKLGLVPMVQVYKLTPMQGLPESIKCVYVGRSHNLYVYNLNAADLLTWIKLQETARQFINECLNTNQK
jgi:hypothetical protein